MAKFLHVVSGIILLALVLTINIAGAAGPEEMQADLNVSKTVSSAGPYQINDEVSWAITLRNNGPANATNITLNDVISPLQGLKNITAVADSGEYNTTTNIWSIDELKNATFATLTLTTSFSSNGTRTNRITITGLNETDPVPDNNQAEAVVRINASDTVKWEEPLLAKLVIKPTTLILNSKGVFTVFVSLYGSGVTSAGDEKKKPRIDYANSSLFCGGAEMVRATVSSRDGGTLIAKFYRADLMNITPGQGVRINCSGSLKVNGESIPVEGTDTIRVIGEKKGLDKILSRLWKFLGIEKDDVEITESEDGNITVTLSLDPDMFRNSGQAKKMLKTNNNGSDPVAGNETAVSDKTRNGKENRQKNNGDTSHIQEKNAGDKPEKGRNGSDKHNDESPGKSNGKKNT